MDNFGKTVLCVLIGLMSGFGCFVQYNEQDIRNYIEQYADVAIEKMQEYRPVSPLRSAFSRAHAAKADWPRKETTISVSNATPSGPATPSSSTMTNCRNASANTPLYQNLTPTIRSS